MGILSRRYSLTLAHLPRPYDDGWGYGVGVGQPGKHEEQRDEIVPGCLTLPAMMNGEEGEAGGKSV